MNKSLGFKIALSLFFLASTSWAQLNLNADPRWRALMRGSLDAAAPVAARSAKGPAGLKSTCTATANCGGGTTVSCAGTNTCTAVDQSCPNQQGYVNCGSSFVSCPNICIPNCPMYNHGSCNYSWDPDTLCCVAFSDEYICPFACVG